MTLKEKEKIVNTYEKLYGTPFHMGCNGIDDDEWILVLKKCLEENREWTEKDMRFSDEELEKIKTGDIMI